MKRWQAVILGMVLAGSAVGQEPPQPVDEGIADSNVLSTSLRELDRGLRAPVGFDRVYRAPQGGYMRVNGGLYAVFPNSVYGPRGGVEVPPGTTFYIGMPPTPSEAAAADPARIDAQASAVRLDTRIGAEGRDPGPGVGRPADRRLAPVPPVDVIVRDPAERARRLESLMRRAAIAEMSRRRAREQ